MTLGVNLLVISTGGTIGALPYEDPVNPPVSVTLPLEGSDPVRAYIASWGARYHDAGQRDSKRIDDPYRCDLQHFIEAASETSILITNGTDCLVQTADFLYRARQNSAVLASKTLVLTGSMIPLSNGAVSDGYLNMDFARDYLCRNPKPGLSIVLCDYEDPEMQSGWYPRLYPCTKEGQYVKARHAEDGRYHRLILTR